MKPYSLTDQNIALLSKVLDLRAEKEKVIASNIANSETPGYAPSRFTFEEELKNVIQNGAFSLKSTNKGHITTSPRSIETVTGRVVTEKDTTGIGDLNGVSLEAEMLALSTNELLYETAAQLLSKKLSMKKYLIQGGQ